MGTTLITWVGGKLLSWTKLKREDKLAAISGLTPAVAETIAYNNRINKGFERNKETEEHLHKMWYEASSAVSRYDTELAMVCREKAKYWLNYDEYTDSKVAELNIELVRVAQKLEDLKLS
ncbi:TPA: hypothetical protein OUF01_000759 [Klebsiella michiganensis]|nr:hypothetical protein [Klebsiella michiganensis]HCU0557043.1 hypothetical protein [Klebsiella michiganensis]HCU0675000.1 hypothetical protein [Klebsiella michiganensis]